MLFPISEFFEKLQMSEFFDVSAGCTVLVTFAFEKTSALMHELLCKQKNANNPIFTYLTLI